MANKFKQMADEQAASASRLFDNLMPGPVKDSAQQIWLAGLGAFARAQAEGTKVFEALVREGANLQKKTSSVAEETIDEVTSKASSVAGDMQSRAGQQWDKLEGIFEERTAKVLTQLGVPTAKDLAALVARVDALSAEVARLSETARDKAEPK